MARPDHLFVFAYDMEKDSARVKLARLLEGDLDRVQKSVFEGRLSLEAARRLAALSARLLGPDDSLRVYCITEAGRKVSIVHGRALMPEPGGFWLL